MTRAQEQYEAAGKYLDARKRLKRIGSYTLVERFGLSYIAARQLLHRKQWERGEISLADLLPAERRAIAKLGKLDIHALAAGPIMDSNQIYRPAGKCSLAEVAAREALTVELLPASVDERLCSRPLAGSTCEAGASAVAANSSETPEPSPPHHRDHPHE